MAVHEIRANSTKEQTWLDRAFKQITDKTSEIYRSLVASFPQRFIGDADVRLFAFKQSQGCPKLGATRLGLSLQFEEKRRRSKSRMSSPALSEDLKRTLARSIETALDSLGGKVGQVILYHIEKQYSLKVEDIIDRPESFMGALQGIFGDGAFTLEQIVVETVLRNIPVARENLQTRRFCRLMAELRQRIEPCVVSE